MSKRTFRVVFELDDNQIDDGVIELDQSVIDHVDDEWRKELYASLTTPEKIAAHIAYNMVLNNCKLTEMDGWADMDDSLARMIDFPIGLDDFMVTAEEIKEDAAH